MTTQVIFKIDKKLKEQAMRKARAEGVPFASVLKFATKAYVSGGFDIGIVESEVFNAKTRRELTLALKETKQGKNLSPAFSTAKEAMAWLRK
jgi:antitoxin component of RelBE/YafQ-DinJ toxin-antitoxin module